MFVFEKGWYSIAICHKLKIETIDLESVSYELNKKEKKFIFLKSFEKEQLTRYKSLRKTWIRIDYFDEEKGLIKKKVPVIKSYILDYFKNKDLIIFHSGANQISNIVKYLNKNSNLKIILPRYLDLKLFLNKLKSSEIKFSLLEGNIVNYKLTGGTIGSFHFKKLNEIDLNDIMNQSNSFLSWIKLNIGGKLLNYDIEFYSNGTYYHTKSDNTIFNILKIYLNLEGDKFE